jgi:hypothetical protein
MPIVRERSEISKGGTIRCRYCGRTRPEEKFATEKGPDGKYRRNLDQRCRDCNWFIRDKKKEGLSVQEAIALRMRMFGLDPSSVGRALEETEENRRLGTGLDQGTEQSTPKRAGMDPNSLRIEYPVFQPGRQYSRKADIHERYGGQQRGGISTPAKYPVIFIFTGSAGKQHGYRDIWLDGDTFEYWGEGQIGDMSFTSGNKAVRDHIDDGKDLLLFESVEGPGGLVRYVGSDPVVAGEGGPSATSSR